MTSRLLPALLFSSTLAALAGCSTPTIVTLNDGREIQAVDAPRYDRSSGFHKLEQLNGKRIHVNKDQVRNIKDM